VELNNMSTRKKKERQPVSSQQRPDCHGSTSIEERILELAEHAAKTGRPERQ